MNPVRRFFWFGTVSLVAGLAPLSAADSPFAAAIAGPATPVPTVDGAMLPRYPAVEPSEAIGTWKVKPGFKLQLAAHEPQVRDPIAISFDENGRMFVCEMIDYSELRDVTPHLGRISMLEDKDGDGYYETSVVFADDLPWPTGLIWANGGLYVGATPDIWRFEDRDGDGRAEVRQKIYTGFGAGEARLNVQQLLNSFAWGQDNRVHVQTSTGRGRITAVAQPERAGLDLKGRDFWFDPRTGEFGAEAGGAQYGMGFDNYGRKFASSNSDHLQFWVYDDRYVRNSFSPLPGSRQSIAADGGAAEVYRISPDEPWRIIRTRWRIGGIVGGPIEGGGRVSGYFTGATGTTVYRGDAYGHDFVNNTFTGDAGGQLIHRKRIFADGASLVGRRPDDEQGVEFAASTDTWVRVVNFANAPDGSLHVCDLYREIIEHPWSIPAEIKQHLDLNRGNDRGRIYRIVPADPSWRRRDHVALAGADTARLVATLEHPNGWHRDTASRLIYERQDPSARPLLARLLRESKSALGRHHALGALDGLGAVDEEAVSLALADADARVRERGVLFAEKLLVAPGPSPRLAARLAERVNDPDARVRFQLAFTVQTVLAVRWPLAGAVTLPLVAAYVQLATQDAADPWLAAALLSGAPEVINGILFPALTQDTDSPRHAPALFTKLIEIRAASLPPGGHAGLVDFIVQGGAEPQWLRAFGAGLQRAGFTLEQADPGGKLAAVYARAAATATSATAAEAERLAAIQLLGVASLPHSQAALVACLGREHSESVQSAAIQALAQYPSSGVSAFLLRNWPNYGATAKAAALAVLGSREDRTRALLEAIQAGTIPPAVLPASQVQALVRHRTPAIATLAKAVLASVIPPSRVEVATRFQPAVATPGDAVRGQVQFAARCMACHRAAGQGMALGPDLITVRTKGRESLLAAIIDPNREVASPFIGYELQTKDGRNYTGIIAQDDATGLVLKVMGGTEITIPRAEVRGSRSSGQSLMPEGLEAGLGVQEMADLLTFIETLN